MPHIFVSYRRATSGAEARSIALALERRYGERTVFFDIESLEYGRNFDTSLEDALSQSSALVVLIDESWTPEPQGRVERLFADDDYVRREIQHFLDRKAPVLPVFLGPRSTMPAASALPSPIQSVTLIHGARVTFENFSTDIVRVFDWIDENVPSLLHVEVRRPRRSAYGTATMAIAAIAVAGVLGTVLYLTVSNYRSAKATLSRTQTIALQVGQRFQECDHCPRMAVVPAGTFQMGSAKDERGSWQDGREQPQIEVSIPQRFAIAETEVTVAQFAAFARATDFKPNSGCRSHAKGSAIGRKETSWLDPGIPQDGTHPVVCVSWEDARAYSLWLSSQVGAEYRLPSEAEWEFASRSGTTTPFAFGDTWALLCEYGNIYDRTISVSFGGKSFCTDGHKFTAPAGSFSANHFGLFDMHGNVWEWVQDCWVPDHTMNPKNGQPVRTGNCSAHTQKGGDWIGLPQYARSSSRHFYGANARGDNVGFRVVRVLE